MCLTPFAKKSKEGDYDYFPCGKCPPCLKRRVSGWSFRLMQEGKRSASAWFVTLTYNSDNLQFSNKGFKNLYKKDLQDFFKRLRKRMPDVPIKYYAVGEYGTINMRPHYHAIMFNVDPHAVQMAWSKNGKSMGDLHFGDVNGATIGYTLKYMSKPSKIPLHKNDDRTKEFSLMSKGLGENYITVTTNRWHTRSLLNRMYLNVDGKKIAMPRYYKDRLYTETERQTIAFHAKIDNEIREGKNLEEMIAKYGDDYTRIKAEGDIAAFRKMHKSALQNRRL